MSMLAELPHPAWMRTNTTGATGVASPAGTLRCQQGVLFVPERGCGEPEGDCGYWPATAAAAPWERREAGSSRSADHKNLSVPSSLLSYPLFFFFRIGFFFFVFTLANLSSPAD